MRGGSKGREDLRLAWMAIIQSKNMHIFFLIASEYCKWSVFVTEMNMHQDIYYLIATLFPFQNKNVYKESFMIHSCLIQVFFSKERIIIWEALFQIICLHIKTSGYSIAKYQQAY